MQVIKSILISFLIIFLLFPIVKFLLVRLVPSSRRKFHLTAEEMEEFQKLEWMLIAIHGIFATILTVAITSFLTVSASIQHHDPDNFLYILTPSFIVFLIPGIILGIMLGVFPLLLFQKSILRERYYLFDEYLEQRYGFDLRKSYYAFLAVSIAVSSFLIYSSLGWYVKFGEKHLVVKEFMKKDVYYRYTDIVEFREVNTHYEFYFSDGKAISTKYLQPNSFSMIAYVAKMSGKKLIK